jgi:hypothetical protein
MWSSGIPEKQYYGSACKQSHCIFRYSKFTSTLDHIYNQVTAVSHFLTSVGVPHVYKETITQNADNSS